MKTVKLDLFFNDNVRNLLKNLQLPFQWYLKLSVTGLKCSILNKWIKQSFLNIISDPQKDYSQYLGSIIAEITQPYLNKSHNWFPFLTPFLVDYNNKETTGSPVLKIDITKCDSIIIA